MTLHVDGSLRLIGVVMLHFVDVSPSKSFSAPSAATPYVYAAAVANVPAASAVAAVPSAAFVSPSATLLPSAS